MSSESTVARIVSARQAEDEVLAESAFQGERLISLVRLAFHILRGASIALAKWVAPMPGTAGDLGVVGSVGVVLYLVYALVVCWGLWRPGAKASVRASLRAPTVFNVLDFGFNVFMSLRAHQMGEIAHLDRAALGMAVFLCFSLARQGWTQVLQSTVFACGSYLAVVFIEGDIGGWPSTAFIEANLVSLGILIGLTNARIRQMFTDLRKRDNLQRFLPGPVARRLLNEGEASLQPVQREVTVLFVDIRDFTTLSEALAPREVLMFLDDFFGHIGKIVKGRDGIVNKFLGDGMLAFWGVPERDAEHAKKAVMAVLDLRKEVADFNADRGRRGLEPIRIGMGVHSGIVAAGMLGGADQHEYTVIGDAVNVASRVEGLTKSYRVDALVSEATWKLVGGAFRGGRVGEDKVKGRQETVVVYSVLDRAVTANETTNSVP
jgi:adenylate cyclase